MSIRLTKSVASALVPIACSLLIQTVIHLYIDGDLPLSGTVRSVYFWESRGHTGSAWFDVVFPACICGCIVYIERRRNSRRNKLTNQEIQWTIAAVAGVIVAGSFIIPWLFNHETFTFSSGWIMKGPLVVLAVYFIIYTVYVILRRFRMSDSMS